MRDFEMLRSILLILFISLVEANLVWSNAGPVETGGVLIGEPVGFTAVRIEREELEIDFRSLNESLDVRVQATYHLFNPRSLEPLELAFAFGSKHHRDHEIKINGQRVEGKRADPDFNVSEHWFPPRTTPPLRDDETPLTFGAWQGVNPLLFRAEIPEGISELEVTYVEPVKVLFARPAMFRQFVYIFAPARNWAGFGDLKLSILLPEDWEAATNLALDPGANSLRGTFNGLPDDALAITLRPKVSPIYHWVERNRLVIMAMVMIVVSFVTWWRLRRAFLRKPATRKGEPDETAFRRSLITGVWNSVFTGLMIGGCFFLVTFGLDLVIPMAPSELNLSANLGVSDGYASLLWLVASVMMTILASSFSLVMSVAQYLWMQRFAVGKFGGVNP